MSFDVADGLSSADAPRLIVYGSGLTDAELAAVASAGSLRTWPELSPVASTTEVKPDSDAATWFVSYKPTSALGLRWYGVYVKALPAEMTWSPSLQATRTAEGGTILRFNHASEPAIVDIVVCAKDAGRHSLVVFYSESLRLSPAPTVLAEAAGGPSPNCRPIPPTSPEGFELPMVCEALDITRKLRVSVGAATSAASGVVAGPLSVEFTPESMPREVDGCWHRRTPA